MKSEWRVLGDSPLLLLPIRTTRTQHTEQTMLKDKGTYRDTKYVLQLLSWRPIMHAAPKPTLMVNITIFCHYIVQWHCGDRVGRQSGNDTMIYHSKASKTVLNKRVNTYTYYQILCTTLREDEYIMKSSLSIFICKRSNGRLSSYHIPKNEGTCTRERWRLAVRRVHSSVAMTGIAYFEHWSLKREFYALN